MIARQVLLAVGWAGIAITLTWAALNHIGNLNARIGGLEADNAQLEQQVAAMAEQRKLDQAALVRLEADRRAILAESEQDKDKFIKAVRDNEGVRDWAGAGLPADVIGLFNKPGSVHDRSGTTGQPAGSGAGSGPGR